MSECERIRELIERRLDEPLSPAERESVQSHVPVCSACGAAQRQLQSIDGALKSVLAAEAARVEFASFWDGIERRLNGRRPWFPAWRDRWLVFPRPAWTVPAVIAVLLAVLSLESYWPGRRGDAPRGRFASVDSIDAHGRSVALVRENETRTTVIWLYNEREGEDETAAENRKSDPAF